MEGNGREGRKEKVNSEGKRGIFPKVVTTFLEINLTAKLTHCHL